MTGIGSSRPTQFISRGNTQEGQNRVKSDLGNVSRPFSIEGTNQPNLKTINEDSIHSLIAPTALTSLSPRQRNSPVRSITAAGSSGKLTTLPAGQSGFDPTIPRGRSSQLNFEMAATEQQLASIKKSFLKL